MIAYVAVVVATAGALEGVLASCELRVRGENIRSCRFHRSCQTY